MVMTSGKEKIHGMYIARMLHGGIYLMNITHLKDFRHLKTIAGPLGVKMLWYIRRIL